MPFRGLFWQLISLRSASWGFKVRQSAPTCLFSLSNSGGPITEHTDFVPEFIVFNEVEVIHNYQGYLNWPEILENLRGWVQEGLPCRIDSLDMTSFLGDAVAAVIRPVRLRSNYATRRTTTSVRDKMVVRCVAMANSQYVRPSASFISLLGPLGDGVVSSGEACVAPLSRTTAGSSLCPKGTVRRDFSDAALAWPEIDPLLVTRLKRQPPSEKVLTKHGSARR